MSTEDERLQQDIFALLAESQGIKLKDISLDKSLNFDLGVDGDDAQELFFAYSDKFHVDITPLGLEWERYFSSEPNLVTILQSIASLLTKKRKQKLPLPVSRLLASARTGRWIALEQ